MESIQELARQALSSIGAVQPLAVAAAAGVVMRNFGQMVYITLSALVVDQIVGLSRASIGGASFGSVLSGKWQSFLSLPMGNFLAAFISFAVVIAVVFGLKTTLKRF